MTARSSDLDRTLMAAAAAVESLSADEHGHEKVIVGLELRLARAAEDFERLDRRRALLSTERGTAEEERETLEARRREAGASIARLETDQRAAEERLAVAQRKLLEAREGIDTLARQSADAKAAHATLVERVAALVAEVQRLEETAADLIARVTATAADRDDTRARSEETRRALVDGERSIDTAIAALDELRRRARDSEARVGISASKSTATNCASRRRGGPSRTFAPV